MAERPSSATASPSMDSHTPQLKVRILDLGPEFQYTVPSFSVATVYLRQATMQVESDGGHRRSGGDVQCIDGFIRSDDMLSRITRPFLLTLTSYCLVPVDEFCKVVYVRHLRTVEPGNLLIAWEGEIERMVDEDSSSQTDSTDETESLPSSDTPSDFEADSTQSMVTFKVIGVLRDQDIQNLLKQIGDRRDRGEDITVKLSPEPENIFDGRAICFEANIDGVWKKISYVVREIVEEVHSAIENTSIVCTEFAWVKYKLWKKAPGYYAAVCVTRTGQWSSSVHKAHLAVEQANSS